MTQVTHGLTRDELVKRVYGPQERLLKALKENRGNYTIDADGRVNMTPEAVISAVENFGNQQRGDS